MKIIAVGRNYSAHVRELDHQIPDSPVIFLKPDTAYLKNGASFLLPDFSHQIEYEAELVIKISKDGKHIAEKFASNYYDEITVGLDLTARDLQNQLKDQGLPWELCKAFDHSAPIGSFKSKRLFPDIQQIPFTLNLNGKCVQNGNSADMLFPVGQLIAFISSRITLRQGDLIMTGTPAGVGCVHKGDLLEAFLGSEQVLSTPVH